MKGKLVFAGVASGCCFIGLVAMLLTVFTKEGIADGYRTVADRIRNPFSTSLSVKDSISRRKSDGIISLRKTENVGKYRTKRGIRYDESESQEPVAQDQFQFVNFVTPNPNIEITIEVVDDVDDYMEWSHPPPARDEEDEILKSTSTPGQGGRGENSRVDSVNQLYNSSDVNSPGGYTWLSILRQKELFHNDEQPTELSARTTVSSSDGTLISSTNALKILDTSYLQTDDCNEWMSCRSEKLMAYLSRLNDLPSCPCFRPPNLDQHNAIFDQHNDQLFPWVNMIVDDDWLDIYKPSARNCIMSLLSPQSTSLAAQQCCYDDAHRLITRGAGAGTPHLVSTEISPELNYKIDIMPWIICKGDWTRYNRVRPPNNAMGCQANPDNEEYRRQRLKAKNF